MEEKKNYSLQNNTSGAVVLFFILLFVFSKWGPSINFNTTSQVKGEPMVVTGEGKTTIVPDIARISAGIEEKGTTLKTVQESVNSKSQNLVSELKKLGIDEKDIKTSSYNIYPQTDYDISPPKITGYRVSVNYQITVRDTDKANDVLVTVTASGANLVGGISFDLSDEAEKKAYNEARRDAIDKAKEKASSLANASGVTLGKILNVTENGSNSPYRYALPISGGGDMSLESKVSEPDIEPGTTEINLSVSLYYEVR